MVFGFINFITSLDGSSNKSVFIIVSPINRFLMFLVISCNSDSWDEVFLGGDIKGFLFSLIASFPFPLISWVSGLLLVLMLGLRQVWFFIFFHFFFYQPMKNHQNPRTQGNLHKTFHPQPVFTFCQSFRLWLTFGFFLFYKTLFPSQQPIIDFTFLYSFS
jgi:hypothetical protein